MSVSSYTDLYSLRSELFQPSKALPVYVGRPDWLQSSTWLQIPINPIHPSMAPYVNLLWAPHSNSAYTSSIIGKVNSEDLFVGLQGDCIDPAFISGACFRLSLSSPQIEDMAIYDRDFGVALRKLQLLAISAQMVDVQATHMIDVFNLKNRITFYSPLMHNEHTIPSLAKTWPYRYHPCFMAHQAFYKLLKIPLPTRSNLTQRSLYPMPPPFNGPFMLASKDLVFSRLTVYDVHGALVDAIDVPNTLKDAIVQVDFEVSASAYAGMIGRICSVSVL